MNFTRSLMLKTLFALLIATIIILIVVPIIYFVSTSFFSSQEVYSFPRSILPKYSWTLRVEMSEDLPLFSIEKKKGEYQTILHSDNVRNIKRYFNKELSIDLSTAEINDIIRQAPGAAKIYTFKKSILYNYKLFFTIVENGFLGLWNSIKAAFLTIIISLIIGSMAGYSFARYTFKGQSQLRVSMLLVRMFPMITISLSLLVSLSRLGLFDTILGLSIAYSTANIALTAWITTSIFMGIDVSLEEAAQVFGASPLRSFFRITFPIALPGLVASSMYAFLAAWNDTVAGLLLTEKNPTFSVAIYKVVSTGGVGPQFTAAGTVILILPALIFTFIIKNYLTQMWGDVEV